MTSAEPDSCREPHDGMLEWLLRRIAALPRDHQFLSDQLRGLAASYWAAFDRGEARGWAKAVLIVLDGRGVVVPDDVRDRVLECTDIGQLDTWLDRAATATAVDDVIRESDRWLARASAEPPSADADDLAMSEPIDIEESCD